MRNPYEPFDRYVLRTPLLPFIVYDTLSRKRTIPDKDLEELLALPKVNEAIFLASPDVHRAMKKWLNTKDRTTEKSVRIRNTLLKYISRMCTRCTPFGLFAGTSVGHYADHTDIFFGTGIPNRHTRLDMNYLVALAIDLSKRDEIKKHLVFYPNTSIYRLGGDIRYIEYSYKNSRRAHHVVAVEETEYLAEILIKAQGGANYQELVECLVSDEITSEESKAFMDELIDSQFLTSELEPSVCGEEFTNQLLKVLHKIPDAQEIVNVLCKVIVKLERLDTTIGNDLSQYEEIKSLLDPLGVDYNEKFLYQTDLVQSPEKNVLAFSTPNKIKSALRFLNRITVPPQETMVSKFADSFYERYEGEEVPLYKAMDTDLGIGFDQSSGHGDISAIVDDVMVPYKTDSKGLIAEQSTAVDRIILKKLRSALSEGHRTLELKDSDFKEYEEHWEDLPDTLAAMCQHVSIEGEDKIFLGAFGGSSAANLLGRFCHGDEDLFSLVSEITETEGQMASDHILAEIVHLPESRMGNILMRPSFRNYEIPFLAKSGLPKDQQLRIEDLVLRVSPNKKITLKSKSLGKKIMPRLTNAHNYSARALPVYQCLANLQHPEGRKGLGFGWPASAMQEAFLPRVIYDDFILSPMTWNITSEDVQSIKEAQDEVLFRKEIELLREKYDLPEFVLFKEGDNELIVRLMNDCSVRMFIDALGNKKRFQFVEFLHYEAGVIKSPNGYYTNQIVVSFYNEEKLNNSIFND